MRKKDSMHPIHIATKKNKIDLVNFDRQLIYLL